MLPRMNPYTAKEHLAAQHLREVAATLVTTYADAVDLPSARIALLMQAAENEAIAQGRKATVVFRNGESE